MKAFKEFENMNPAFWAFIKFISENLGYTEKKTNSVKSYSKKDIIDLLQISNIKADSQLIENAINYIEKRAKILNNDVQKNLMNAKTAEFEFKKLEKIHTSEKFFCKLPMNKQKGDKKNIAFFTSIINIITEKTIREITKNTTILGFDDDLKKLSYVLDEDHSIIGATSRRFDGAYPSNMDPQIIWEIKEYYYTTTFGSRIADGVYETQLDGFELKEIYKRTGIKIQHIFFIDAYDTWWIKGKSYLCRLIDAINSGVVDEVIFGKEVLYRWPEILSSIIGH